MSRTKAEVEYLQRLLNAFTTKYLKFVTPLRVDGDLGQATKKRIRDVKWYLGYTAKERNGGAGHELMVRLRHPKRLNRYAGPTRLIRAARRRRKQRREAQRNHDQAAQTSGVGTFDGRPCANWLIPYLQWARNNGWHGYLVSGWRDPAYSEQLCYRICGRPRCPGLCAGRASHHSGSVKPEGAVDVSDYVTFGHVIARCPLSPRIFNNLPSDRVHFSASGG